MNIWEHFKGAIITVTVIGAVGSGFALVANMVHADECPAAEAAAGLCVGNASSNADASSDDNSNDSGNTDNAESDDTQTPSTTDDSTQETTPAPERTQITKALVLTWCNDCSEDRLTELPEFGKTIVKIAPGAAVTVDAPSGICIDTPNGNMLPSPQTAPTMTVRNCEGGTSGSASASASASASSSGNGSTSSSTTTSTPPAPPTTQLPATASNEPSGACDPSTLGGNWVPLGSNMWKLVGSITTISVPEQGPVWIVDHPMGSISNGQSVRAGAATAYCTG